MYSSKQNGQRDNPSFIPDNVTMTTSFAPVVEKEPTKPGVFVVELQDSKKPPKDEDYDPYQNREVDHPTTNTETLLHLLKGSLGTGILAMPKSFFHAGYVVGAVGTITIGLICTYCIHLLIKSAYELCRRRRVPSLTYPATAEAALSEGPPLFRAFAPYSVHVVNAFLLVYQLGICCVYVLFVSENIKDVVDIYWHPINVRYYALMLLLPLIFINWVPSLKLLAPFSTLANVITVVTFSIIVYYIFREPLTFEGKEAVGEIEHFPLFFGTVLFALEAIGVIMPLENEMKTPKSFGGGFGVLNKGMYTIILLYAGMGFLGYLKYGEKIQGSITLNLPDSEIMAQCVKLLLAFAIYITHALQCYVAVDITWNEYLGTKMEKNPRKVLVEYIVRTAIVVFTFLLAIAVPCLDLFISLFGALCLSALGMAFPAIIQSSTYWYSIGRREFIFMSIKNTALVLFGVLGLITGTYVSLKDIIHEFS